MFDVFNADVILINVDKTAEIKSGIISVVQWNKCFSATLLNDTDFPNPCEMTLNLHKSLRFVSAQLLLSRWGCDCLLGVCRGSLFEAMQQGAGQDVPHVLQTLLMQDRSVETQPDQ